MDNSLLNKTTKFLGSLKLSVALLLFSILLLFFGTLDQVSFGVSYMLDNYIESFFCIWTYNEWLPYAKYLDWLKLPLLGGYTIGISFLVNIFFGYIRKVTFSIRNVGLILIHSGVILILIAQGLSQIYREEFALKMSQGQVIHFASIEKNESKDSPQFSIQLNHFDYDFYPKSQVLRSLSSSITLKSDQTEMEAIIRMNQPFRWGWYTFYQSSHLDDPEVCYLQVVYNPTGSFPYIATLIIFLGLLIQFGKHLTSYLNDREAKK